MSNIEIHPYEPCYRKEWEQFVRNSDNGTMFQLQAFLDYHNQGKFNFHHFMFRKDNQLVALLPGGFSKQNSKQFWSPVGASYGSFVADDIPFELSLEIVDSFMEYCPKNNIDEVFLIPPPIIYSRNIAQHFEYAMLYRKFDFEYHYISHAIELRHGADFLKHFDKTSRKSLHKILREGKLEIRESKDYATFNEILIENKARHNVKPTHSLEDMIRIAELLPENVRLNLVYYEGKAIAGSWLFFCNNQVVLCFYNMMKFEYEHLRPIYLIMYETVRRGIEEGYRWVDIGVSQDTSADDPMTPSINLINFKERFDSRGILRSTYHFKFR
ncbi:MAG: GNAT family N-acetyltransferase [Candidatus Kapabacteria bacterium]|nr:GNAT family N-acetyltransferase [Candidatus Kapabacteria bacterium]